MIKLRPANERGHADHGWLDIWHTFSFNTYHDRNHMGFGPLRVINEDKVAPGNGFGTHPHKEMEIITCILEGALEHKDSMGNGSIIRVGDVQRMSAGSGITHSEFNPSETEPVHLLQIWIKPNRSGVTPSYEQKHFSDEDKLDQFRLIASPNGSEGSVKINQDARLYSTVLSDKKELTLDIEPNRHIWVQTLRGRAICQGQALESGDGLAASGEESLKFIGVESSELLIFDLPDGA